MMFSPFQKENNNWKKEIYLIEQAHKYIQPHNNNITAKIIENKISIFPFK